MQSQKAAKRFVSFFICLSLAVLATSAQERKLKRDDVPPAVIAAFKSAYPKAKIRGFAKERENGKDFYEIESTEGTTQRDVLYNPDGSVLSIEETIEPNDLPDRAKEVLRTEYPWVVISKVEKLTAGDKVEFEVSSKIKEGISFVFDKDGKLLRSALQ